MTTQFEHAAPRPERYATRVRGVVACLLLVALGASLYLRETTGAWLPSGHPPRVQACGRTYLRGDVQRPSADELRVRVATSPPVVGSPVRASKACGGAVPTVVWLPAPDGERAYGLVGGP